ncbi:MAG: hypothetical protein IAF38_19190, partial [Bacteroidia bacterium]|nr:hypothetical protein [Bacteroidia bacterium]
MKNAFLILAHKNPGQMEKFIRFLSAEEDNVFVHIDKRENELFEKMISLFKENKNVHFVQKRFAVYWGSYNQIKATLELIRFAKDFGGSDYFHLLSGQDLPVMNLKEINSFLTENRGTEFIECFPLPDARWNRSGGMDRLWFYWLDGRLNRFTGYLHLFQMKTGWKRNVNKYKFYGGTNWFTLSKDFIGWMFEYLQKNPAYLKRFRGTRNADEIFVQTLIMNSPFEKKVQSKDLRYINWNDGPEYPRTLRTEDFNKIFAEKGNLFARK